MENLLTITAWVPALTVPVILAFAGFLARKLITTRLNAAVKHEYDQKLKKLESDLKRSETEFNTKLQAESSKMTSLRAGALEGIAKRHEVIFEKRIEACAVIWETVVECRRMHTISSLLMTLNVEELFKAIEENPQHSEPFKQLDQSSPEDFKFLINAHHVRPHVSLLVWAYYAAYEAILTRAVATMHVIKHALPKNVLAGDSKMKALLKVALPELSDTIDKIKPNQGHIYLEHLEQKLLDTIQRYDLKGIDLDQEALDQASEVIKLSMDINKDLPPAPKK